MELHSNLNLMEIIDSVKATGEPGTIFISSELGNLEEVIHKLIKDGFRITPVPPGCITFFPAVSIEYDQLFHFCKEYCIASQTSRATMRRDLYLNTFTCDSDNQIVSNQSYSYNYLIRIAELCLLVSNSSQKVVDHLYSTSPYLQISPVKEICSIISSLATTYSELPYSDNEVEDVPLGTSKKSESDSFLVSVDKSVNSESDIIDSVFSGSEQVDENVSAKYFREKDFELVTESGVFRDHDKVAAVYVRKGVKKSICKKAANCLEKAATTNNLRSGTNGGISPETGIVGYYDYLSNPTPKKCRETEFMRKHWTLIEDGCSEFLSSINTLYCKSAPAHFKIQEKVIPQSYQLFGTVFSTVTVNRNFRTAPHTDKGDFKSGLAALCVVKGNFTGCHLAIPKIGKAFELKVGDVLFFDASLLHGNTEVSSRKTSWERISVVCYLRNGLMSEVCDAERRKQLNNFLAQKLEDPMERFGIVNINGGQEDFPSIFIPTRIVAKLASAQLSALRFAADRISNRNGCIISMEMGLGKTLVALTLAFSSLYTTPTDDILVIAPKSCIVNWVREIAKWSPLGLIFEDTIFADGSTSSSYENKICNRINRRRVESSKRGYLIVLNPEIVQSFCARCPDLQPRVIFVDEGHCLSSKGNKLIGVLNQFKLASRVVLTGTPLQNEAAELYRLVQWVYDGVSDVLPKHSFMELESRINDYVNGNDDSFHSASIAQQYIIEWMKAFVFRELDRDLPPVYDYLLVCGTSDSQNHILTSDDMLQKTAHRAVEHRLCHLAAHPIAYRNLIQNYSSLKRARGESATNIQYRKCARLHKDDLQVDFDKEVLQANSNALISRKDDEFCVPIFANLVKKKGKKQTPSSTSCLDGFTIGWNAEKNVEKFASHSGKLSVLLGIAHYVSMRKEKAIIFSQYVGLQSLIHRILTKIGYKSFWMRGKDSPEDRKSRVGEFLTFKESCFLVLSSKIAAFGHDFTEANHVVLFDLWWNPQVELQAIARSYRRNQTKPVVVYRLASEAEDRHVLKVQLRKLALFHCIMNGSVSRSQRDEEFVDSTDTEQDGERKALWLQLKNDAQLSGGFAALAYVYRYSDGVKKGSDLTNK